MIYCAKCKTSNPPDATVCLHCSADLLPPPNQMSKTSFLFFALGLFVLLPGGIAYLILSAKEPAVFLKWIAYILIGIAVIAFIGTMMATFGKKAPDSAAVTHEHYATRARRHISLDAGQALADFNKALEMAPKEKQLALRMERFPLYEKLEMFTELAEELKMLIPTAKRQTKNFKGVEQHNMKIAIRDLYTKLEETYKRLGNETEVARTHLAFTYYAQAHQKDLYTGGLSDSSKNLVSVLGGDGDAFAVGFDSKGGTGMMDLFFQDERKKMVAAGQVKAVGFCPECDKEQELDGNLNCPVSPKHKKLRNIRFFVPGDENVKDEVEEKEE